MSRRRSLFWAVATVVALLAVAVGVRLITPGPAATPRHVILFTLDTTRADAIGSYGAPGARTPRLDGLAARGVRFGDAVTAAPITGPAHAAIFTGQYPARFGVRDNVTTPLPDAAETLAERLSAVGFATGGFIGAFVLDRAYGFAQGFSAFGGFSTVESGREANAERPAAAVVDDALRWLTTVPADRPLFLWVHLYDPHAPYAAPGSFGQEFSSRPYAGEVAYMDTQIGRVLDALEARGTLNDSLIMAVADHGESLGEHGEDEHGVFLYEPVLRVPWIVAGPGVTPGAVVGEQVRVIDLVPTVLSALGMTAPQGIDGESLAPLLAGGARPIVPPAYAESYYPKLHYGWSELRMLRADGWKIIDAPSPELYALSKDPREANNLVGAQRTLADQMVAEARRQEREMTSGAAVAASAPDRESLERLRSLGYIGTAAPLEDGERGPDPKDRIEERRTFKRLMSEAIDDLRAARLDEAVTKLRALVALNERAYDLHQLLGEAYGRLGRLPEALGEFDMAALLNPGAAAPHLSAAELLLEHRDVRRARARLDLAAGRDPGSFDVALVGGLVLEAEERPADAFAAYERAITINPANPRPRMRLIGVASQTRRFDVAEREARALLAMNYRPSRMYLTLGGLAQLQRRIDEAARHYREALRLEPGLTMAAEALRQLGR